MSEALTAAQRQLEAAQKAAERDMEAAALAERKADDARSAASKAREKAEAEKNNAQWQLTGVHPTDSARGLPPKGRGEGPSFRAAQAAAEAAMRAAEQATAEATRAEERAVAARARVGAATGRATEARQEITRIENRNRADRLAKEKTTQTAIAIGTGFTASIGLGVGADRILSSGARKEVKLLEKNIQIADKGGKTLLLGRDKTEIAKRKIRSSLNALNKSGATKPLTLRGLAGKTSVPLGLSAALLGTSSYLKGVAAKQRELGNESLASSIETFALAEQYTAVGLTAKAAVSATYSGFSKLGKPTLSVRQLAIVDEAGVVAKGAKAAKAPAAVAKPGSMAALKNAAQAMGATVSGRPTKAKLNAAIAKAAGNAAQVGAKSTLTGSAMAGLKTAGGVALKAAGKVALPLAVATTAYAAFEGYRKGGIKGAAFAAVDSLTLGATSAIAATFESKGERTKAQRAVINQASARISQQRQALAAGRKSDGFIDAHTRRQGTKLVQIEARRMTAKEVAARMR